MPKPRVLSIPDDDEVVTKGYLRKELGTLKINLIAGLEFLDFKFEIRTEIASTLNEFTHRFVTREQWTTDMDQIMGVLKEIQEDLSASLYRSQDHNQRIEQCEDRLDVVEKSIL
jgi:hypothetical protein